MRPSWFDAALACALLPAAALEAALREGLRAHLAGFAFMALVALAIWQRRPRPLTAMTLAFGPAILFSLATPFVGRPAAELFTPAAALLIPYSLLRWGSGRQIRAGLVLLLFTYLASLWLGNAGEGADVIGSAVVMLFPAAVGTAVRFRAEADRRALERARLEERAHLARDLHDTVAHHVSAIAIQAQAGRLALARQPLAAAAALETIESEARSALSELRNLVRSLREAAALTPQPGLEALTDLTRGGAVGPAVRIEIDDDLGTLTSAVEGAVYRIVREATTNARRHARSASHVLVRVARSGDRVRVVVEDDGAPVRMGADSGFGIVGMRERATLLGGTLEAGPIEVGGFRVVAEIPAGGRR